MTLTPSNATSQHFTFPTNVSSTHNHTHFPTSNLKIIALINGASGAKKGLDLVKQFKQLKFISVYNIKDLSLNDLMRETLANELITYKNKCIVLICGGDGTNIWATSLIDQSISLSIHHPLSANNHNANGHWQ